MSESACTKVIEHDKPLEDRAYEQARMLSEYLLLHFGENMSGKWHKNDTTSTPYDNKYGISLDGNHNTLNYGDFGTLNFETGEMDAPQFPSYALNFPYRVAQMAKYWFNKTTADRNTTTSTETRALDVGCATGRTTFELSPYFDKVTGLDYSSAFVNAAEALRNGQSLDYTCVLEGDVSYSSTAKIDSHICCERVNFIRGDACNLPQDTIYDCIVAANLIDRVPSPKAFLTSLYNITTIGSIIVLTSPYTWLEQYTPSSEWLIDNDTQCTFPALNRIMTTHGFVLLHQSHMPFYIRETIRKSQFTFAHCTVWQRVEKQTE